MLFLRDEMANLAWAVERFIEGPTERPLNRPGQIRHLVTQEQHLFNRPALQALEQTGTGKIDYPLA